MELAKIGKLVYLFIMFVYGFVVLALAISAYSEIKKISDNFGYIMDNWKLDFINGITVSSTGVCPSYYSPFFSYSWPGTVDGCYCSSLAVGACNSTQISRGCRTISSMSAETWSRWGSGATICVKRISGYSFAEKALKYPLNCGSNEKSCQTNPTTKVCVPNTESCPITRIYVGTSPPGDGTYQSIPYYSSYRVYYSTDQQSLPLVESLMMEDKPCIDKTRKNISPSRTDYMLMKSKRTRCSDYDNRWQTFATIDETSFYSGNGRSGLSTSLPGYSISSSYSWSQTYRNNFPWKYDEVCRNTAHDVYVYKDKYNLALKFQLVILIINIFAAIFLSVLFPFFEIQNLRGVDLPCFKGTGEEEQKRIKKWGKILKYTFKFIQLPFFIAAVVISGAIRIVFVAIGNENCSDSLTNSQFKDVGDSLDKKVYSGNITNLALLAAFLALDLLLWAKGKYCSKKKAVQPEETAKGNNMMSPTNIEMNPVSNENAGLINNNNNAGGGQKMTDQNFAGNQEA